MVTRKKKKGETQAELTASPKKAGAKRLAARKATAKRAAAQTKGTASTSASLPSTVSSTQGVPAGPEHSLKGSSHLLTGYDAVEYAMARGFTLNKYATRATAASKGLTVDEAKAVAARNPSLVWIEATWKKASYRSTLCAIELDQDGAVTVRTRGDDVKKYTSIFDARRDWKKTSEALAHWFMAAMVAEEDLEQSSHVGDVIRGLDDILGSLGKSHNKR